MLVLISDLHLTDVGQALPPVPFRIFRERLRDMAYDASWRAGSRYRPVEELDLVLLGDILDLIRSELWPAAAEESDAACVRPWSDAASPALHAKLGEIACAILDRNEESLAVLRGLHSTITLPPAVDGRPARVSREPDSPQRIPVTVRIHYLAGNHDWMLHLPGEPYDRIRQGVIQRLGLANPAGEPFPYDSGVLRAAREHRVFLRHGDFFDPFNFHGERKAASIGDAIVIELLNRFCATVERELGEDLPRECLDGLRRIDHVRPLVIVPVWVDGLLRRACVDRPRATEVKRIWDRLADRFLELKFVRRCAQSLPPLTLDKLALALKFSKGLSLPALGQLFSWLGGKLPQGNGRPSAEDALAERAFRNRRAHAIVYGHTHRHEIVPLYAGSAADHVYANTGTWRLVTEQTRLRPDLEQFVSCWVMSWAAFYKGDERGGRPFEAWSGTLALPGRTG